MRARVEKWTSCAGPSHYAEALKAKFDIEIQSDAFGFERTLYIECSTCEYHYNDHNDVSNEANANIYFHPHVSSDSSQNAATTFEHINIFIRWMY